MVLFCGECGESVLNTYLGSLVVYVPLVYHSMSQDPQLILYYMRCQSAYIM